MQCQFKKKRKTLLRLCAAEPWEVENLLCLRAAEPWEQPHSALRLCRGEEAAAPAASLLVVAAEGVRREDPLRVRRRLLAELVGVEGAPDHAALRVLELDAVA